MRWKLPFGLVAIGVGLFALYAAWAHPPFKGATLCGVVDSPGVHFAEDWALQYYNDCGGNYDHQHLYLYGFTAIGLTLVGGGAATIREVARKPRSA